MRDRDETGRYSPTVTADAVLDVFNEVDGPVVLTRDVADALECSTEAARQRLNQLANSGELEKRIAGRTALYWRPDVSTVPNTPDEPPQSHAEEPPAEPSVVDELMSHVDVPGFGQKADARRAAVRAVLTHLVEHTEAESSELKAVAWEVDSETYADKRSLWSNAVVGALNELDAVESAGERRSGWMYRG